DVAADTGTPPDRTGSSNDPAICDLGAMPPVFNPGRGDEFDLIVSVTRSGSFTVDVTWPGVGEDYDVWVFDKDGLAVGNSGNPGPLPESVTVACPSADRGPYKVRVTYMNTSDDPPDSVYQATATYSNSGLCPDRPNVAFVGDI